MMRGLGHQMTRAHTESQAPSWAQLMSKGDSFLEDGVQRELTSGIWRAPARESRQWGQELLGAQA
jgi:hypothetical protein